MRLNEHGLHTWDIEVVNDPSATAPSNAAALVVDNLDLIARFTATDRRPGRRHRRHASAGSERSGFVRLIYGRLDPEDTPPGEHRDLLDLLRRVYPGP